MLSRPNMDSPAIKWIQEPEKRSKRQRVFRNKVPRAEQMNYEAVSPFTDNGLSLR